MPRARVELPSGEAIRALVDGKGHLALHVTPGAREESLRIEEGRLHVRVRARAHDGKANAAVLALVARALVLAPSRLRLVRGATSREKVVALAG